ncbi:hypothetical protein NP233_g7661 [Leucocoprinus birnbaumii]|uniref:PLAC8-domain-containing protein n=1 Tax=Leucocoprinus birnbaumii TaxID=56174 RepID=A0AAD5VNT8_9AGAR|nr:hypothetical protein NP233_g7661 [Leucocoprinus birnbaumii]
MAYQDKPYAQQPQATPGMMIGGGGNRNAKNLPMDADGRDWSNGLCDCCDAPGTCLLAWCCPCIVYSKNKHRYEHLNSKGSPDPDHGGGWILQFMQRGNVRSRYNIKGGGCGDCCTAFWCSPCELTQESAELELEEKSFGGR